MSSAVGQYIAPQGHLEQDNEFRNALVSGAHVPATAYQGQSKSIHLLVERSYQLGPLVQIKKSAKVTTQQTIPSTCRLPSANMLHPKITSNKTMGFRTLGLPGPTFRSQPIRGKVSQSVCLSSGLTNLVLRSRSEN